MNCKKKIICRNKLSDEEIISLMGIYREEWQYRDSAFISTFFKFSLISLSITFFPYLVQKFEMNPESPLLVKIPDFIFSIFGIIFAVLGLIYSFVETKRIEKIDNTYKDLMKKLPDYAQIKMLKDDVNNSKSVFSKIHSVRLNNILCSAYFIPIGLAILNIVLICL